MSPALIDYIKKCYVIFMNCSREATNIQWKYKSSIQYMYYMCRNIIVMYM